MNVRTCLLFVVSLCACALPAAAQDYLYATGSPVYATSLPIDHGIVNVNNGDIHIEIPIATKTQRGDFALEEKLVYDSRIWKIVQNGSTLSWQPTNTPGTGGWSFSSGSGSGSITYQATSGEDPHSPACGTGGSGSEQYYTQYNNWTWTDPSHTVHSFPTVSTVEYGAVPPNCTFNATGGNSSSSGSATDGSGYTLEITNYTTPTIIDSRGMTYHPSLTGAGSTTVVDRNGNYWSTDASGDLVDTSGITPVLVTTSGSNTYYDVLGVNGVRNRYTVTMETVSFNTDFNEQPVHEDSGSFSAIQSITLPDGSSYSFTYGSGTSSGSYGEMTSMTLPTGGVVGFGYTNFYDSFNNENRWLSSLIRDGGTTTFTPAVISTCSSSQGCQENMTVASPDGNATVYTFNLDKAGLIAGSSWVSAAKSYQGSASSGTLLRTTTTAYAYSTGTTETDESGTYYVTGSYEIPATLANTVTLNDVGVTSQTSTTLNGGECPSEIKDWNFGNASTNAPDTDTLYSGTCGFPTGIVVKDGSGNQLSSITYGYDETTPTATSGTVNHTSAPSSARGNRTSEHDWANTSGSTLNTTMTYDDTGALLTSTSPTGKTTYGHDSTDTFVTSTTDPPVPSGVTLEMQTAYDASTGAIISTTDENNRLTEYSSFDSFNRSGVFTFPDGRVTDLYYRATNYSIDKTYTSQFTAQSSGSSTPEDIETEYDAYGRLDRVAELNGQSTNNWNQVDTCYDTSGRIGFKSYQYQGDSWSTPKKCSGAGDAYSYDALGRVTQVTHADGTFIAYTYKGRAVETTDENGASRISQSDAFGRLTGVCEITSQANMPASGTPTSCGLDIAGTGFFTGYAYNLASHLTTLTQGVQTRQIQTDSIGRTIATSEPERGQTSYAFSYNSTGLQVVRTRPAANQSSTAVTTTTTQYDSISRPVSILYSDGTPEKGFTYDLPVNWANDTQSNVKGQLSQESVATGAGNAATNFSYDALGRVLQMVSCRPSTCGVAAANFVNYTYDYLGNQLSATDGAGVGIGYVYSLANEIVGIGSSKSDSKHPATLVSNVINGADGPVSFQYGNGLDGVRLYDINGQLSSAWLCAQSLSAGCSGGTQLYGYTMTEAGGRVNQACDSELGPCAILGYDSLNRLISRTAVSGNSVNNSWTYDRYGNRWSQSATVGVNSSVSYNTGTNRQVGLTYDAAGNVVSDGIHTYTYDAEGNVTKVDSGATATYFYDALNRRVRSVAGGGWRMNTYLTRRAGGCQVGMRAQVRW